MSLIVFKDYLKLWFILPFHPSLLFYNQAQDFFVCPMGQKMLKVGTTTRKTSNGYPAQYSIYQAINCQGCPLRPRCHQAKGNRKIYYNHSLQKLRKKAREKLKSPQGIEHRKQRGIDVEAVFGQLKQNWKFTRLSLRSLPKVNLEVGLMAMAHNFRKWYQKWKKELIQPNNGLKTKFILSVIYLTQEYYRLNPVNIKKTASYL